MGRLALGVVLDSQGPLFKQRVYASAPRKETSGFSADTIAVKVKRASPGDEALPPGGTEEIGIPADGAIPLADGTRSSSTEILGVQRGSPPTA